MEYYILVTNSCNMQCKYCIASSFVSTKILPAHNDIDTRAISKYIIREHEQRPDESTTIVFYGGEPLLNQSSVVEIIKHTKNVRPMYFLYTNGLLLKNIDKYILQNVSHMFVSFDGLRDIHDRNRMVGTYDLILESVKTMRTSFAGSIIARITFVPESNIYTAVNNCLKSFDAVFWQQASSPNGFDLNAQVQYQNDVSKLISEWLDAMKAGVVRNIIPFQAILGSHLIGEKRLYMRCGFGSSLRVINKDGKVYSCDEMIRLGKGEIGTINNGCKPTEITTNDIKRCIDCEVRELCGGRCYVSHMSYSKDKNDFYCANTKHLIHSLVEISDEVKALIARGIIRSEQILTFESRNCTEEIP